MRTLLAGTLAATLVGCSCLLPPQGVMETCTDAKGLACLDRTVASQPIESKPASFKANSATVKAKSTIAAKTQKPSSDDDRDRAHIATKKAKSTMAAAPVELPASDHPAEPSDPVITIAESTTAAKVEKPSSDDDRGSAHTATKKATSTMAAAKVEPPPASSHPAEPSDPVLTKAKTAIAAKLEVPVSAEFGEMKRAFRKNTFGQSVDTICGRVKGKKASGENTGDRPFLYLVKEDDAYVVDGPPSSEAASAYRNICN
jgi:hypothetical protein